MERKERLISGDSLLIGKGDAIGAAAKVTNQTTNNFGTCTAENLRADAILNKVLDMLQAAQERINEIQIVSNVVSFNNAKISITFEKRNLFFKNVWRNVRFNI